MSSEEARDLQERGIQAVKAGQQDEGRRLLQQSLRLDPNNDTAWLWLASVARNRRERLLCLQKVLEINPNNEMGLKAVRAMGVDPEQLITPAPSISDSLAPADAVSRGPGVPLPEPDSIEEARELAEQIADSYLQETEAERIEWVHKTRGRAGEREIVVLRLQVAAAVLTAFVVVLGGLGYLVANSPQVQLILLGASATPRPPTSTPTNTPTNTPGFTPTPSPTREANEPTFTLTPTIPPSITPGQIEITPRPTEVYLPAEADQAVRMSNELLNDGQAEEALPLLATARAQLGQTFNPNPFYYEALAHAQLDEHDAALNLLSEAEGRIERLEGVRGEEAPFYQALIDLGVAEIRLQQAKDALEVSDTQTASARLQEAQERAEAARSGDPRLAKAHAVLAETYRLQDDYDNAIDVINNALTRPEHVTNLNLILEKGRVYMDRGRELAEAGDQEAANENFDNAIYQGFYATYINPYSDDAQQLRIQAALEKDDPGLAVIYTQQYLFFRPDSAQAFRLLGEARTREGNLDLALDAYTRALEAGGSDAVLADVLVSRAELYSEQQRLELALEDLNEAIELNETLATRARRMRVAYAVGDYEIAQEDADALLGSGIIPDDEVRLVQARILIDEAGEAETSAYSQALSLLNNIGGNLPAGLGPVADEYRARAHLRLGNVEDALNAINRALNAVETGSRHYLRGLIFKERDSRDEAIAEFEWVLTWNEVYNYDFADDAREELNDIHETIAREQARATATAQTATAEVIQATEAEEAARATATATAGVPRTETAEAQATATATAGVARTETAEARATATATAGIALTETAEAQATATATAGIPLTETVEARETATATAGVPLTETVEAEASETAEVVRATAVLETATQVAADRAETATARALASPTPTRTPTAAP